jgi:short-subunit dehydrogenase
MRNLVLNGRWVIVTGASSGLGREMARDLAKRHHANLILVARRRERLEELKAELTAAHGIEVRVLTADLARASDVDRVFTESTNECEVHAVILNAGVGHFGPHHELSWSDFEVMLDTNVKSAVRFTHHFVPYLLGKDQGGAIMLVTSMTGLLPTPYQTAYSATKAFLTTFGLGLFHELAGKNISITTFAPGGFITEMTEASGLAGHFAGSPQMVSALGVARQAIDALVQRSYLGIPGSFNRLQLFLPRLLPRRLVGSVMAQAFTRALKSRPAPPVKA